MFWITVGQARRQTARPIGPSTIERSYLNGGGTACAGGAGDEHTHAGEQRQDEDDDEEEDLPADADRGVAGEPDVVPDHHVINDALEAADHVLDHGGPRQAPHGARDGPFDDRAIECRLAGGWRLDAKILTR